MWGLFLLHHLIHSRGWGEGREVKTDSALVRSLFPKPLNGSLPWQFVLLGEAHFTGFTLPAVGGSLVISF